MSFKISTTILSLQKSVESQIEDIGNRIVVPSSNTYPTRQVEFINNGGGGGINENACGSIIYSYNQTPGQWVIDDNSFSPAVGTEFIIYNGNVNPGYIQSFKSSVALQISGGDFNSDSSKIVNLGVNCKCVATKVSDSLWVIQGDGLSYS